MKCQGCLSDGDNLNELNTSFMLKTVYIKVEYKFNVENSVY